LKFWAGFSPAIVIAKAGVQQLIADPECLLTRVIKNNRFCISDDKKLRFFRASRLYFFWIKGFPDRLI